MSFRFGDGVGVTYQHVFSSASNVVVNHGLGHKPVVWIEDENNKLIYGDITFNSLTTFTVVFAISITGVIYYR